MGKKEQVAVGLSGGVDSAVAAALLLEQGYGVVGVYLECWAEPGCRVPQDRKDALAVALRLRITFQVLDYRRQYKEKVLEYFFREYKAGRTPNPDVMCNLEIKFGLFYKWALENGFDYLATGHYARIKKHKMQDSLQTAAQGLRVKYKLFRGKDEEKDQSYFLYRLKQEQLEHILFPIGDMSKKQVRAEAKKRGLPVADKPDSQGICFIGKVKLAEFLKRRIKEKKGEVVDVQGNVLGEHRGIWFYTIGQRHGFTVRLRDKEQKFKWKGKVPALYVVAKNVKQNCLIVGTAWELEKREFRVSDLHWIDESFKVKISSASADEQDFSNIRVRIRHGGRLIPVSLKVCSEYDELTDRVKRVDRRKRLSSKNI